MTAGTARKSAASGSGGALLRRGRRARPLAPALDLHPHDGPVLQRQALVLRVLLTQQRRRRIALLAALEDRRHALEQDPRELRPVLAVAVDDDRDAAVGLDVPHASQCMPVVVALRV